MATPAREVERTYGWAQLSQVPELEKLRGLLYERPVSSDELREKVLPRMKHDGQVMEEYTCGGTVWDVVFYVCLSPRQKMYLALSPQKTYGIKTAVYFEGDVREKFIGDLVADFTRSVEVHLL